MHVGGDEVGFECWQSNTNITEYMLEHNIQSYEKLEEMFIKRVLDIAHNKLRVKSIVWQEVFTNGIELSEDTIVHVWTGNIKSILADVTGTNLTALLSSCWYLDHLKSGGDWKEFYMCDPHDFPGTTHQKKLVIGGEACMWSESVDSENVLQRIFPRVCAAAERLWSPSNVNNLIDASQRLEEHTCRMKSRGLPAQPPNGPGFCL